MRLLMVISVVCFVIALLGQVGTISGVDTLAWTIGGLLAWALDITVGGYVLPVRPPR